MISTLFLASDRTFRLFVSTIQFRSCLRIILARRLHHVFCIAFLVLYPDSF